MSHALSLPTPDTPLFSHSTYRSPHHCECLRHAGWTDRQMDEWVDAQLCPGRVSSGPGTLLKWLPQLTQSTWLPHKSKLISSGFEGFCQSRVLRLCARLQGREVIFCHEKETLHRIWKAAQRTSSSIPWFIDEKKNHERWNVLRLCCWLDTKQWLEPRLLHLKPRDLPSAQYGPHL